MEKIIADDSLRNQLNGTKHAVEICDRDGKTLGHFLPPDVYRRLMEDALTHPKEPTTEELQRRFAKGSGKPLAQIWKELGRT